MLVAHGTPEEVNRAKSLLASSGASQTQVHMADAELVGV
jgi:hypothetical protein